MCDSRSPQDGAGSAISDEDAGRIAEIMDIAWRGVDARTYVGREGEPTVYVNQQARADAEYLRSLEDSE